MAYRDNVNSLAEKRGLVNDSQTGLRESDLAVGALLFGEEGSTMVRRIIAGKMNRASRLFFEHYALQSGERKRIISGPEFRRLKALAPEFFAELWEDTSERPLLDAFGDLRKARLAFGGDGAARRGSAGQPVATGHAGALESVVERQKGLLRRRHIHARRHAWPASGDSIQGCRPSRAMAFS